MMEMSRPASSAHDIAVVYLARFAEGAKPMSTFAQSYRRHPAGTPHDMIVICKGFSGSGTAQHQAIAAWLPNSLSISDEGFDITAYALAAARLPHKYVVFLNTFSEIQGDDWLRKLRSAFDDPAVGIAGATGSYESLASSMKRLRKGMYSAQDQLFGRHHEHARRVFRMLRRVLPKQLAARMVSRVIAHFMVRGTAKAEASDADRQFESHWMTETQSGGIYDYLSSIPEFPNPHIRTNAFMIERQLFLDALPPTIATKQQSYLFESGPDGLTGQVLRRGRTIVVVGRDGQVYPMDRWQESSTFRHGDQHNLLIQDNQTRAFDHLSKDERRAFAEMTWGVGEEIPGPPLG